MTGRRETLSRLQARHEATGFPLTLKACRRQAVTQPDGPTSPFGIKALAGKFFICSFVGMERIERQKLSAILLAAPGWARIGLTMPDERMRERAADTLAVTIIEKLEGSSPPDESQLSLPL
jgi:hypothetical protein